jgi:hypothetical protein
MGRVSWVRGGGREGGEGRKGEGLLNANYVLYEYGMLDICCIRSTVAKKLVYHTTRMYIFVQCSEVYRYLIAKKCRIRKI